MPARPRAERSQLVGETLQFMQRLWDLVHALDVRSKRMAKEIGVTGPQRLVIRVLGRSPHSTASDVAGILGLHPSTLTGILKRLELQAMVKRKVDPADRRRARFRLTAKGLAADRERKGTVEAAIRRALTYSSGEIVQTTAEMLERVTYELSRDA